MNKITVLSMCCALVVAAGAPAVSAYVAPPPDMAMMHGVPTASCPPTGCPPPMPQRVAKVKKVPPMASYGPLTCAPPTCAPMPSPPPACGPSCAPAQERSAIWY